MSRSTVQARLTHSALEQTTDGEIDEAAGYADSEVLICQQYVVYSATFQVPTFYFTIHDSQGAPLSLDELLSTSLFHRFGFKGLEKSGSALTLPTSSFPLLSQGDHPTLNTPCWYLHPCETAPAVEELLKEKGKVRERVVNVIETWMLIVGNVIGL
ncbi:hypothetical protein M378DRAFT_156187 [Amanita muscaria Koide BX008]|uniref:Ubiquitin-like-conjugating enzyme ATG10 n=1 Tax=Amanita muscaria (strain Koide BX008) TaxID=946122 RepID=A0A0C2XKU6_AMAMK|nr:hypothetical protein M378DRAFT_156187 [Amanita muscaria Koide BX008]